MSALWRVAAACRQEVPWLVAGALTSIVSVAILLVLTAGSASLALDPALTPVGVIAPFVLQALGMGRVLGRYVERMVTHAATFRAIAAIRVWLWRGLVARSAGGLGFIRSGDALSRLISDTDSLDGLYLRIAVPGLCAMLLVPVLVWALQAGAPWAAAVVLLLFAAAALGLPLLLARRASHAGARVAEALSALRVAVLDVAVGLREVTAYGAAGRMMDGVQAREATLVQAQHYGAAQAAAAQALAALCSQGALLAVVLGGGPALVPALFLTLAAFETVGGMPRAGVLAGTAASAARRIMEQAGPVSPPPAPALPDVAVPLRPALSFRHVTFAWEPGRPVLNDFSLDIEAGSRVALLGPSGAGKSTIAALALRIVAPQAGQVLMGGTDLAHLPIDRARAQFAWLGQDTHVFQDSVRANLLLADPDAPDDALWRALTTARLAERIGALPGGLDTILGGAIQLSGGEQRRLALARALLSPAPVLILDEPATGLDAATEYDFFATLATATAGRTVLLIVHRLTGAEQVDRVWRLTGGQAVAATG